MAHPVMLVRKGKIVENFPLILIVGREPNNDTESDGGIGDIPFESNPRCSFWNLAFGILGINNCSTSEIKELIKNKGFCPIIFTDAFPKGIRSSVSNKLRYRKALSENEEAITKHVKNITTNSNILKEVKLVIFSGLYYDYFQAFKDEFAKQTSQYNFKTIEIPFLYGNNSPNIRKAIEESGSVSLIEDIYKQFKNYTTNEHP